MHPSNIKNECYTPSHIIEPLRSFAGRFDLDPFSCELANETVKAISYINESENAFETDWFNFVDVDYPVFFVNPPYSRDLINIAIAETLSYVGRAEIFLLVNSSTSARWYQDCLSKCSAVLFPSKRIQFINPYIEFQYTNEYSPTLFYFGRSPYHFKHKVRCIGKVIIKDAVQRELV